MQSSKYFANAAECYWNRKDYKRAAALYSAVDYGKYLPTFDGWIDYMGDDATEKAYTTTYSLVLDHIALSAERIGEQHTAKLAIRSADSVNHYDSTESNPVINAQVDHDYQRLDRSHIATAKINEKNAVNKAIHDTGVAVARSFKRFASGYPAGDMHSIASTNGQPCHVSTSDSNLGHIEIWYYCDENSIYDETYTFRNGKVVDHTQL